MLDGNNVIVADIPDTQAAGLTLDLHYTPRAGANVIENEIEVLFNGELVSTLSADGRGNTTTDFHSFSIELPAPPNNDSPDIEFEFVRAAVGATIDSQTGEFRWNASDSNIVATENRETETEVGEPVTAVLCRLRGRKRGSWAVWIF